MIDRKGLQAALDYAYEQTLDLDQVEPMLRAYLGATQGGEVERLRAAISWIEPPFVDDNTSEEELRQRVKFCVQDAARAALEKETTA